MGVARLERGARLARADQSEVQTTRDCHWAIGSRAGAITELAFIVHPPAEASAARRHPARVAVAPADRGEAVSPKNLLRPSTSCAGGVAALAIPVPPPAVSGSTDSHAARMSTARAERGEVQLLPARPVPPV